MKTNLIIVAVIILHKVPKTKGKEKFECPVDCPSNVYRPICSRGKSYASLCVLKREICKGKTAREIYDDVEACPGYEKEDDASGKSIEAIDKNGVIFRHLIDFPKKEFSASTEVPKRSSSTVRTTKKSYYTRRETVPTFFVESCWKSSDVLSPSREEKTPFGNRLKKFLDVPVATSGFKRSKNRGAGVDLILDRNFCQINCDPNEYRRVCAGKRAFRGKCYLKKAFCSGSVGKDILEAAKTCPRAQNKRKKNKN